MGNETYLVASAFNPCDEKAFVQQEGRLLEGGVE